MKRALLPLSLSILALAGCAGHGHHHAGAHAKTTMQSTAGNTAKGQVHFAQRGDKVIVHARIEGLKPNSEHGFHVHDKGDCSAPDASSAGGHFNPSGKSHGHHDHNERHAGDMPNLKADANGRAEMRWESTLLSVQAGPASVVGRSVVIHAQADDYKSQPAGNSGPRIACGVIAAG